MKTRTRVALACVLVAAVLLTSGVALAALGYSIPWYAITGGGGRVSGGGYVLQSSFGVPLGGTVSAGNYRLCVGFWCGVPSWRAVLNLPVIEQNHVP